MAFDPTKPVQTRDGRKARVICTDFRDPKRPIVAVITRAFAEDGEYLQTFKADGTDLSHDKSPDDLVNVPEKARVWIEIVRSVRAQGWEPRLFEYEPSRGAWTIATVPVEVDLPEDL